MKVTFNSEILPILSAAAIVIGACVSAGYYMARIESAIVAFRDIQAVVRDHERRLERLEQGAGVRR